MKNPTAKLVPLIATGIVPSAAMVPALLSPSALAAPGDLDPDFGDLGRLGPILDGPAWSLDRSQDGSMLLGGGTMYPGYYYWGYYYYTVTTNFVTQLTAAGAIDAGFAAAVLADIQVFDVARQPDGNVVATGRKMGISPLLSQLVVFRLQADGSLDTTFGIDGIVELSVAEHGDRHMGNSVLLEADGRIVVAGSRDDQVMVLRLLPDGSPDDAFGTSGFFVGSETFDFSDDYSGARTSLLRTTTGGYRVTASNLAGCQVLALTDSGALDNSFGTAGLATVAMQSGLSTYCNSMAAQPDDRILVAGHSGTGAFAARVLADGQPDPGFAADAVANTLAEATSVAAAADGSIIVAGQGVSGEAIMRLQASGELDALFGDAGITLIDLDVATGAQPIVRDLAVADDGSVVAAGGDSVSDRTFVIKLLGAAGGDSPGVLGTVGQAYIPATEGGDDVVLNVRRSGGASGSVSLAYQTLDVGLQAAKDGEDFLGTSGRLSWDDGDRGIKQIRVPILADNTIEPPEQFAVILDDLQGGAGLGTSYVTVEIAADGGPHGQLSFTNSVYSVPETEGMTVQIPVSRSFYYSGAVSVTLTPVAGTATIGSDFIAAPVTLSWADNETDWKFVDIPIVNDDIAEGTESFTLELSNPTGGAILGPQSTTEVRILISDQQSKSGGGVMGWLSLLLLGAASMLRRLCSSLARVRRSTPGHRAGKLRP